MEKIKIIILAAGKGKRMKSDDPKALAMLKGKPFIRHILDTIEKLNPAMKPVIVIGHKKERIEEVLGKEHTYAHQAEQLGTAHAVEAAKSKIGKEHEIILVISVDQPLVSKETLETLISVQEKKNPAITMGTVRVPDFKEWREGLHNFGRIVRRSDNTIEKIVESKDASEEEKKIKELNPALYAFDAPWLWENIHAIKNNNAQAEYYLTDLVRMAAEQGKRIETIDIVNSLEALQPNSKEELEILEKLMV